MVKNCFSIAVVFAMSLVLSALELPTKVKFDPSGSFKIDGIKFEIRAYSEKWELITNRNWQDCNSQLDSAGLRISGTMQVGGQSATVTESIKPISENAFRLEFLAKFASKARLNVLHGGFSLPIGMTAVRVDGKLVALPAEFDQMIVYRHKNARELSFTTAEGTEIVVSGTSLDLTIQDNRKYSEAGSFSLRIGASPASGFITNAKLSLDFKISSVSSQKVDLSTVVNAGFVDEIAGDGEGGWTDQGSDNDLRSIQPGEIKIGGLAFDILDSPKNHGRGCIVLSGSEKKFIAEKISIPLPSNQAKAINLLHASAWAPLMNEPFGLIIAEYADGTTEQIPIRSNKDCGNWWITSDLENAAIAWRGENSESAIGLYASSFGLSKPGPIAIRLEVTAPRTIWMIAGVTLSDSTLTLPSATPDKPLTIKENYQWKPLTFSQKVIKGGVLDFSAYVDAPAGKYGFIRPTPEGRLSFEKAPEKRVKLYGPNLVLTANFLDKEVADQLVETLVYCGYNTVRFHHQDRYLVDKDAKDSLTLDLEQLDKLDYLFFRLKESGIYVTTDLFASRRFKPGDNIPECDSFNNNKMMKPLLPFSRATMENWKEFARRLMNHRNPYTGLTWGEDPALWCINLVNEECLTTNWIYWNRKGDSRKKLYEEAFRKYCAKQGLPAGETVTSNPVFYRFLHELQDAVLEEQLRFAKEELKLKSLVTSLNCGNSISLTLLRQRFEVVDNHLYFDHPQFPGKGWTMPFSYEQKSSIKRMAKVPQYLMPTRIPGKPFIVTEFNYCNPNIYRAEGGPLIGSYAALQGWDALYRFAWSHYSKSIGKLGVPIGFDAVGDPLAQFSDRIAIAMFRRGDVAEAKDTYAYLVPEDCIEQKMFGRYPNAFRNLGLITKIGSVAEKGNTLPPDVKRISPSDSEKPDKLSDQKIASLWKQANEKKLAVSSTGQLRLDAVAGTYAVATPRVATATLKSGALVAGALTVRDASCFQTVAAISLDGKDLGESESVLVFQLTNLAGTGERFKNESRQLLESFGKLPLLVQKGSAVIELSSARPYKVEALNCDGEPYGTVEGSYANGVFSFKADTTLFEGGVMAYHLTR